MSKILKRFGRQLRIFRKQKMLSREELALKSGLTSGEIEGIETGIADPSLSTLFLLAKTLDIHVEDLIAVSKRCNNQYYAYRFYLLNLMKDMPKKKLKKVIEVCSALSRR